MADYTLVRNLTPVGVLTLADGVFTGVDADLFNHTQAPVSAPGFPSVDDTPAESGVALALACLRYGYDVPAELAAEFKHFDDQFGTLEEDGVVY